MATHHSLDPAEHTAALRRRSSTGTEAGAEAERVAHPLLSLQRQVGNAQIARMLAQREGGDDEKEEVQAKHDLAQREGDEEKEEAQAKHDPARAQREGDDEKEEVQAMHDLALRQDDEKEEVQAKPEVGLEGGPISGELSGRINAKRGGGSTLADGTRATVEAGFGTSFKDVRIHHDAESDALNRSISAKAFTTGNDIFFRKDTNPSDQSLLAHELTHVVQQRSTSGGGGMKVGPAGDSHEQHADAMSTAVTSGVAATAQREAVAQREAEEAQAQRLLAQREGDDEKEESQ